MIIGITGQSTVGKTTIGKFLKKQHSAYLIDLDQLAKKIYLQVNVKTKLKKHFGNYIFNQSQINIQKLREIVFASSSKLKILNKIMFPLIKQKTKIVIAQTKNHLIIIEGSILFQAHLNDLVDKTILIQSNKDEQRKRILKNKKFKLKEFEFICKEQKENNNIKNKVDFIIENNDPIAKCKEQINQIISLLKINKYF